MEINSSHYTQKLTTTLNRLKQAGACANRYAFLVKALGGVEYDHDKPINLLEILETNGPADSLWALCATEENCDKVAILMAAEFAETVLHLYEGQYPTDNRPRSAIEATRRYVLSEIGAAADAAWAALDAAQAAANAAQAAVNAAKAAAWAASHAGWAAVDAAAAANATKAAGWAASHAGWAAVDAAAAANVAQAAATLAGQVNIIKCYLLK
jgi:hypothetical protein